MISEKERLNLQHGDIVARKFRGVTTNYVIAGITNSRTHFRHMVAHGEVIGKETGITILHVLDDHFRGQGCLLLGGGLCHAGAKVDHLQLPRSAAPRLEPGQQPLPDDQDWIGGAGGRRLRTVHELSSRWCMSLETLIDSVRVCASAAARG